MVKIEETHGFFDGNFPKEKISPLKKYPIDEINIEDPYHFDYYLEMKEFFMKNFDHYKTILFLGNRIMQIMNENFSQSNLDEYYKGLSSFITTGYFSKYYFVNITNPIDFECQVITPLDKLYYMVFQMFYSASERSNYKDANRDLKIAYFFLNSLINIQVSELSGKHTIDLVIGSKNFNQFEMSDETLMSLINMNFNGCNAKEMRPLINSEYSQIKKVVKERRNLISLYKNKRESALEYICTEKNIVEWNNALNIINDISYKENQLIEYLLRTDVKSRNKLRSINNYLQNITSIKKGFYILKGKKIKILPIIDSLEERMKIAPDYCMAMLESGEKIDLLFSAGYYLMDSRNFNYLIIMLYKLIIGNSDDDLAEVVTTIWELLERNLGLEEGKYKSYEFTNFDSILDDCNMLINSYYKDNKDQISRFTYNEIQDDISLLPGTRLYSFSSYQLSKIDDQIDSKMQQFKDDVFIDEFVDNLVSDSKVSENYINDFFASNFNSDMLSLQNIENEANALPFIKSLNIIYLLIVTINLLLKKSHLSINKDHCKNIKRNIMKIERETVASVYRNTYIDISEYREERIIDIDRQILDVNTEKQNEYYGLLFETVLGNIKDLVKESINENVEGMMAKFSEVKQELSKVSDINDYDILSQVDEMLIILKNRIVEKSTNNSFEYMKEENLLRERLGKGFNLLPESAKKELITAELLFSRYANQENESMGFDFSCISSLFYQAVESTYNYLIWNGYRDLINGIDELSYIELVKGKEKTKLDYQKLRGFLPRKAEKYYVYYDKKVKEYKANEYLMMGNFESLLDTMISSPNEVEYFKGYIYDKFGFDCDKNDITNHKKHELLRELQTKMSIAAPKRNFASHGNRRLVLKECIEDRDITLIQTKEMRNEALGLLNLITEIAL